MIFRLLLNIPEEKSYIPLTRLLGKTTLQFMQVIPADVGDIETILDELCSNVVRHARSENGVFVVRLDYHHDRIVVAVKDKGKGFTFADIAAPGTSCPGFKGEGKRFGGFGLKIVGEMADRLRFTCTDGKGTTVRAEKCLTYGTQAASDRAKDMDAGKGVIAASF